MNFRIQPDRIDNSAIYSGEVQVFAASTPSLALGRYAWEKIVKSLDDSDPRTVRYRLSNDEFFSRFSIPRRELGRDSAALRLTRSWLHSLGCPDRTLFDRPRLRAVQSGGHHIPEALPAYGIHRDTWYANPQAQVNHWLALHDTPTEEMFGFFLRHWERPIANTSHTFDYHEWNQTGGFQAYQRVRPSEQRHPIPTEDPGPCTRTGLPEGHFLRFSAAHLHGTLPHDTGFTRYSLEVRTVDPEDVANGFGAPNLDNRSKGDMTGDLLRLGDE